MRLRSFRLAVIVLSAAAGLGACSGPIGGNNGGGGGGGGGTAGTSKLIVTMTDSAPAGVSILGSPIAIRNLAIDQATGQQARVQLVPAGQTMAVLDVVRLQSDSTFAGAFDVKDDTYKALFADFVSPALDYFNAGSTSVTVSSGQGFGFVGGVAIPIGGNGSPLPAIFAGGAQKASYDLNQNIFITTSSTPPGLLVEDFLQPNAVSLVALPHKGVSNGLELVEDFIGTVTAVSGNTVTIQRNGVPASGLSVALAVPLPLVATATASTRFDNCPSTATIACVHTNQIVSVDAVVDSAGTVTLLEVDDLSDTADKELEGTIASIDATNQVFTLIVADEEGTNSTQFPSLDFTGFFIGLPEQVGLASGATFSIDTKGLPVPAANLNTFTGFSSLAVGQTVRIKVASTSGSQFNASKVTLRFTRLTGRPSNVASPVFTYDSTTLPPYFGLTGFPQVQTFPGTTLFDGVSDLTGVTTSDSISIRALYLPTSNPPFFAAKVRKH